MIKFGIRQSFDRIDQIEDRYMDVSVPVEVALPYYWDIYEPIRTHLGEVAEKIKPGRVLKKPLRVPGAPLLPAL